MSRQTNGQHLSVCGGYDWLYNRGNMKFMKSIVRFNQSEVAQVRLDIVEFSAKHGIQATVDAYGISRRTLFRWKKALKDTRGRLESLVPTSTKPHHTRRMLTPLSRYCLYQRTTRDNCPFRKRKD